MEIKHPGWPVIIAIILGIWLLAPSYFPEMSSKDGFELAAKSAALYGLVYFVFLRKKQWCQVSNEKARAHYATELYLFLLVLFFTKKFIF